MDVMNFLETADGKIEYFQDPPSINSAKPNILLIPNSYGLLTYMHELAQVLNKDSGFNIFSFNFGGQGGSDGTLSLESAARNLESVLDYLEDNYSFMSGESYLYINCSGLFPVLELAKMKDMNYLNKVIIYNYLHTPSRLYRQAMKKMDQYGVRHEREVIGKDYNVLEGFKNLRVPVTIVHPQIKPNRLRATKEEISSLCSQFYNISPNFPTDGYDICNESQYLLIKEVVDRDINPLFN